MDAPDNGGWRAFFMEVCGLPSDLPFKLTNKPIFQAEFLGPGPTNYRFTTEVVVTPNTFPYEPCYGASCYGTLL